MEFLAYIINRSSDIELYGNVGQHLGIILNRFLGGAGSIIFLITLMIAILIFAFDIKLENIFRFIMNLFNKSVEKIKNEYEEGKLDSKQEANLEKIKSLREDKKAKESNAPGGCFIPPVNS